MWISTSKNGVYKYIDEEFVHVDIPISIMDIEEDQDGIIWLAGAGGLYKIGKNDEVINVTVNGPWE